MIAQLLEKSRDLLQPLQTALARDSLKNSRNTAEQFSKINLHYLNILLYPAIKDANGNSSFIDFTLLRKPAYRQAFLTNLPIEVQRFQYARRHFPKKREQMLEYCQKHHDLSNSINTLLKIKPHFLDQQMIHDSHSAVKNLGNRHFELLLISAIFHNFIHDHDEIDQAYFFQSLEQAWLCYQIALSYRQSPLNSFISTLVRSLSLIAIRAELESNSLNNIKPSSIIEHVATFLPKLDYWFAKDIGLSDELLFDIKNKYLNNSTLLSDKTLLIGEFGHQCIQLYQQKILGKKELTALLQEIDQSGQLLTSFSTL